MIAGALTALLLYLLARILFKRRSIAVLAGILVAVDGMFFVQSRIAMNDVYVGLFIVAAYTLFAAVWTGWWRWRWAWLVGLPVVGVLLGLALASKWVGLYAIAGVGILILGRSALGRIILILSMIGGTVYMGNIALTALPAIHPTSGPNYIFVFVMVGLTLAAVLYAVLRPVAWTDDETRLAIAGPAGLGILLFLAAVALNVATTSVHAGLDHGPADRDRRGPDRRLGRRLPALPAGRLIRAWPVGAPARADRPAQPGRAGCAPPPGWLRLGWGFGIPIAWMVATLLVLPLVVYVVSYLPWVALGNRLTDTWPPGHTGQTLIDLTKSMYDYHNNLRATHPASSPFWAWPLDLKPVWFYQASFAGNTSAAIYDNGNLVTWWLEIPAIAFVAWQAFKRGSLGPGPDHDRLRPPVGALDADRPGDVPVPLLHQPAVPGPGPGLLPGRAVARRLAPDLAAGPGLGRRGDPRARPAVGVQGAAVRLCPGQRRQPRLRRLRRLDAGRPAGHGPGRRAGRRDDRGRDPADRPARPTAARRRRPPARPDRGHRGRRGGRRCWPSGCSCRRRR